MIDAPFTLLLEAILAILLVVAAIVDVRTYTISNRLTLLVVGLAPLFWWTSGMAPASAIAVQIGMAAGVFGLLALCFYMGMMGGGDVKLAAALALWFSPASTVRFLVFMSLAGGLLTLAVVAIHRARKREGRPEIPYGVAIAAGGLTILAQRFLNQFV